MSSYLSPVIQHNDQIIFVKGSIKEKEIDFLLDTGAEITVIPTKLAQGLNIPYKKTKLCLTGVIGEDSVLYETPPIEVKFGPKTLTTKLLCAPLNTGAILGMDLLRQINLILDMSSESTSIKISSAQISTNNATPPQYAFLQNHPIWAKDKDDCGFLTGVEPVKLIKVKAHLTTNTTEAKGNALADVAAKQACFYATVQVCSGSTAQKTILPPESIVDLYKDVDLYEAWTWLDKGATVDSSGCWTKGGKYVAPESLFPYLAQQIHSLGHSGPATMNHRFSNQWWNPKFRNAATETVKRCVTCQKNNDVPAATTPAAHTPAPPGPFRHLQVDYISLPPCKGKTDVLVVIDKFSRWVEAYPTGRATAAHTAKCLVTDFIPRWGLPDCIDSDQGAHFTGQVVKEVSRMLKIKWNLHCPYRPQASGQVERSNRTIKTRLSKMHQEGVPWVEALPAVLCSMRASPNRSVGLSPHEIITGRPMQMPGVIDLRNADVHIASDALIAYCENLTKAVQSAKERVESCWQTPPEGGHNHPRSMGHDKVVQKQAIRA